MQGSIVGSEVILVTVSLRLFVAFGHQREV